MVSKIKLLDKLSKYEGVMETEVSVIENRKKIDEMVNVINNLVDVINTLIENMEQVVTYNWKGEPILRIDEDK